jgi:hypothetical protein
MTTGRPLLGVMPTGRYRVAYWNGEDPLEETERRVAAATMHYALDGRELEDWLAWGSGRECPLVIATQDRSGTRIAEPVVEQVINAARHYRLDAIIVDPFVSSHRVTENDNNAMDSVVKTWNRIADETNVSVELVHHTRKSNGQGAELTVEDGRGAVSLLAGARSARVLNPMTLHEAEKGGVEQRRSYFRISNGKSNLAPPPEGTTWCRYIGVDLGNGPDGVGDNVGVVTSWTMPDAFEGVGAADTAKVQQAIDGGSWRESPQAREWVGYAVADALAIDLGPPAKSDQSPQQRQARARVKSLIHTWLASGVLVPEMKPDGHRELKQFVVVGQWVIP